MPDAPPRARKGGRLRALAWQGGLALAVVGALLVWATPEGAWTEVLHAVRGADPLMLGAALALYPLVTLARALRLAAALRLPRNGRHMLAMTRVAAMHSLLSWIAPMRLGELSLVWLLNRAVGTPIATGSALLLVLRLVDLVVVLGIGLASLAWLPVVREAWPQAGPAAALGLLALLAALGLAPVVARRLRHLTPWLPARLGRFAGAVFEAMGAMTGVRVLGLLAWTLPIWMSISLMAWLCANAGGVTVGLAAGVAGGATTALASVLPVNTVAAVGTFEAAWLLALVPAGLDRATALATGVLFHAVVLLGSAVLGVLALPGGWRTPRNAPGDGVRPEAGTFPP